TLVVNAFLTRVRELSVSFTRRRQWRNSQNARGAAMKDARIARTTDGQNCGMVVVSAGRKLLRRWGVGNGGSVFIWLTCETARNKGRKWAEEREAIVLLRLRLNHLEGHFNGLGNWRLARLIANDGAAIYV